VPVIMGLVSGGLALLTMLMDLWLTGGDGQKYFSAALTLAVALIVLAYLFIFPAFVRLRITEPDLERPFLVPGGLPVAWAITILTTAWSLLAAVSLLWPGIGTSDPNAALPAGFAGDRLTFELLVVGPIALLILAHGVYYAVQERQRPPVVDPVRSTVDAAMPTESRPTAGQ
jgi:amino acid transporter